MLGKLLLALTINESVSTPSRAFMDIYGLNKTPQHMSMLLTRFSDSTGLTDTLILSSLASGDSIYMGTLVPTYR